jgi:hypothetical protein
LPADRSRILPQHATSAFTWSGYKENLFEGTLYTIVHIHTQEHFQLPAQSSSEEFLGTEKGYNFIGTKL